MSNIEKSAAAIRRVAQHIGNLEEQLTFTVKPGQRREIKRNIEFWRGMAGKEAQRLEAMICAEIG